MVSVVIAAYNESKVIVKTINALLSSSYENLEIVVVDDGSTDGTAETVRQAFSQVDNIAIIEKLNGGKASALNLGIKECRGEVIVALDADTMFHKDTISNLVRHFEDPAIGAVSGNVKVGNRRNVWTWWQALEYVTSQNFDRRAFAFLNCISVVPGAVGAWRKDAIALAGLYSSQTLAEDTDLTFKVRQLGYRIVTDNEALAYTEAPDNLKDLSKQRFRWAYGTLQCLWKHRSAMLNRRYGAFGFFALPSLWIYQILFQALAPLVDMAILWTIFYGSVFAPQFEMSSTLLLLKFWAVFTAFELLSAYIALTLDNEDRKLLIWLPLQRFVYRQMMYYVILKSIVTAIKGTRVGWGKLDRRGTVSTPIEQIEIPIDSNATLINRQ
jgi:cellulose synthase/poly-beta-1,6-N-acetylglucosamine synthase-like glycosyltransferase